MHTETVQNILSNSWGIKWTLDNVHFTLVQRDYNLYGCGIFVQWGIVTVPWQNDIKLTIIELSFFLFVLFFLSRV